MKYLVIGQWTASKVIGTFEADTPEQAEAMAEVDKNNYASLCHQEEVELAEPHAVTFFVEKIGEEVKPDA